MENPTNRELKIMLDNLDQKTEEKHHDVMNKLTEIVSVQKESLKENKFTNGKVANAIIDIAKLKADNRAHKWIIGVISAAFIIAIPIFRAIVTSDIRNIVVEILDEKVTEVKYEK